MGAGTGVCGTTVTGFPDADVDEVDVEVTELGGGGAAAFRDLAFGFEVVGVPNVSKGFAGVLSTTNSPTPRTSSSMKGFPPPSS